MAAVMMSTTPAKVPPMTAAMISAPVLVATAALISVPLLLTVTHT